MRASPQTPAAGEKGFPYRIDPSHDGVRVLTSGEAAFWFGEMQLRSGLVGLLGCGLRRRSMARRVGIQDFVVSIVSLVTTSSRPTDSSLFQGEGRRVRFASGRIALALAPLGVRARARGSCLLLPCRPNNSQPFPNDGFIIIPTVILQGHEQIKAQRIFAVGLELAAQEFAVLADDGVAFEDAAAFGEVAV